MAKERCQTWECGGQTVDGTLIEFFHLVIGNFESRHWSSYSNESVSSMDLRSLWCAFCKNERGCVPLLRAQFCQPQMIGRPGSLLRHKHQCHRRSVLPLRSDVLDSKTYSCFHDTFNSSAESTQPASGHIIHFVILDQSDPRKMPLNICFTSDGSVK